MGDLKAGYMKPDGSYYEGDREHVLDQAVLQRPSVYHVPQRDGSGVFTWVLDQAAKDIADARTARQAALDAEIADPWLDKLQGATPDQIRTYVDAQVTDLVTAKVAIKKLAVAVAYALKGGRDK